MKFTEINERKVCCDKIGYKNHRTGSRMHSAALDISRGKQSVYAPYASTVITTSLFQIRAPIKDSSLTQQQASATRSSPQQ